MKTEKPQPINLKVGQIDVVKLDVKKYIGKKERITTSEIFKGEYGYYVKVNTTPVDVIKRGDDETEIIASRIFGLDTDKNGNYGWGKDTELGLFLTSKNCKTLDDLKGREVIVQLKEHKGKEFLTFI